MAVVMASQRAVRKAESSAALMVVPKAVRWVCLSADSTVAYWAGLMVSQTADCSVGLTVARMDDQMAVSMADVSAELRAAHWACYLAAWMVDH